VCHVIFLNVLVFFPKKYKKIDFFVNAISQEDLQIAHISNFAYKNHLFAGQCECIFFRLFFRKIRKIQFLHRQILIRFQLTTQQQCWGPKKWVVIFLWYHWVLLWRRYRTFTFAFPATEHHRPLASTKLYCLMTEENVFEHLAEGHYMKVEWTEVKSTSPTP